MEEETFIDDDGIKWIINPNILDENGEPLIVLAEEE